MKNEIYLLGLNHRTADVEIREKFALSENPLLPLMPTPFSAPPTAEKPVLESLALSTCNRVELLAVAAGNERMEDMLIEAWALNRQGKGETLRPHVYLYQGREAVKHIFSVAGGLDSMIMGEPQILGQIKQAYRKAAEAGSSRVILNRLMHKTFSAAKRVRTETGISSSAVSVSFAAVELAKRIFGDLSGKKAMLIGAGEMAELAATHLLGAGIKEIIVANRTFERAVDLAARFRGKAAVLDNLQVWFREVDVVICSTGAPNVIIRARDVKPVMKERKNRPMFFIDIAVPRDVDPDVNSIDNVYLYDIDDLREVVEENVAQRKEEAVKAESIIETEVASYCRWLKSLALQPTIVDLLDSSESIARKELARTLRRIGANLNPEDISALETLVCSISRKVCHEPIRFLKRRAHEEDAARKYIDITRKMFNLDRDGIPENAHLERKKPKSGDSAGTTSGECDASLLR